jgi:hypothetical protein
MSSIIEQDVVSHALMKKLKPAENGRLEATWRIYDAVCNIPTGDLSYEQREIIVMERKAAYERWLFEGRFMYKDGLQGKLGYAAAKRQHLKNLKERDKKKKSV